MRQILYTASFMSTMGLLNGNYYHCKECGAPIPTNDNWNESWKIVDDQGTGKPKSVKVAYDPVADRFMAKVY